MCINAYLFDVLDDEVMHYIKIDLCKLLENDNSVTEYYVEVIPVEYDNNMHITVNITFKMGIIGKIQRIVINTLHIY